MKETLLMLLVLSFVVFGCKKDDDDDPCMDATNPNCCNYNPCHDQNEVTANFLVREAGFGYNETNEFWKIYYTDTLWPTDAYFNAIEKNANYTWKIGSEIINEKAFNRKDFPIGQPVEVTLIVEKEPNLNCFPEDDGKDTVTRTILVYDSFNDKALVEGTFRGSNIDEPENIFEVTINYDDSLSPQSPRFVPSIEGLPYGCEKILFSGTTTKGYKQFAFFGNLSKDCNFPKGFAKVDRNKIVIDYSITVEKTFFEDTNRIDKQFVGNRIN